MVRFFPTPLLYVLVLLANAGFFSAEKLQASFSIEDLHVLFPTVDTGTISRFYSTFGNNSVEKLGGYRSWKEKHPVTWDADTDEVTRWNLLVDQSIRYLNETSPELVTAGMIEKPPKLSVVYSTGATDKDGNVLIQILPKRMRLELYPVPIELYIDAVVSYIDIELGTDDKKCTLMIDFRQGRGWPNPKYTSLLEAVDGLAETVRDLLPMRIARALGFPVATRGMVLFQVWKPVIDRTEIPVALIPGGSPTTFEPVPKEGLMEYIDGDIVDQTETNRLKLWIE